MSAPAPWTREQALAACRAIQSGAGPIRGWDLDRVPRGELAVKLWDEVRFAYGLEYGALLALAHAFGLDLSRPDGGLP